MEHEVAAVECVEVDEVSTLPIFVKEALLTHLAGGFGGGDRGGERRSFGGDREGGERRSFGGDRGGRGA